MLTSSLLILGSLVCTMLLTVFFRRYAVSRSLIDVPNDRSSHEVPTPRGGGVGLVAVTLAVTALLTWAGDLPAFVFVGVGGAGALVALIGFLDDHKDIAARWRLLGHFLAVGWGLYWLGGLPPITLWAEPMELGWLGHGLAAVFLVWLLNLYNFMDGINGIAGIELVTVALGGVVLAAMVGVPAHGVFLAALIASGVGFLIWNFPRARIFMGDACSGFLGVTLGLIAIWQGLITPELFVAWVLLLGVFLVDATVTLVRRIARGEAFYEAHRSHAYQVASRRFGSHTPVSLGVGGVNIVWLLPWALVVALGSLPALLGLLLAWLPLLGVALWFRAGAAE